MRKTINTRLKSPGYSADEIEAPNAYDRLAARFPGRFKDSKYVSLEELKNLTNCWISALMQTGNVDCSDRISKKGFRKFYI
jgi:hypothetical protein